MHMKITIITYAQDHDNAQARAECILKRLTDNEAPFDYYTLLDETVPADSPEGKEFIGKGWTYTKTDFYRNLDMMRKEMAGKSDEELLADRGMWRHYAYCLGQYAGSSVWLYGADGEGIRDPGHLEDTVSKWQSLYEAQGKANPHASDAVWVTRADVHC